MHEQAQERFMRYVDHDSAAPCWAWAGGRGSTGYGAFWLKGATVPAHRVSYEMHVGPIPAGLYVDHLCNNRWCVNPEHLEPVTPAENIRRIYRNADACKNGHPYTEESTYSPPGHPHRRVCKVCMTRWQAEHKQRRAAGIPSRPYNMKNRKARTKP